MKHDTFAVGLPAPEIALPALSGRIECLSDRRGRNVVLIFYRGHWCPACRRQLGQLRDGYVSIGQHGADVLAISTASPEALRTSAHARSLPFPLLSDDQGPLVRSLGLAVYDEERGCWIARPATVLIDPTGTVRFAHVAEHPRDRPALGSILLALEWMNDTGDV